MRFELQTAAIAAVLGSVRAQDPSGLPFPGSTYPGFQSPNPIVNGINDGATSPPKYPSPWMNPSARWVDAYNKARAFVSQLTIPEKVNLTTGTGWESQRCVGNNGAIPRLGFRALCLQDSPLGVRDTDFNSAFPAGVNVAATWSRSLANQRGNAMGSEHRDKGVDVQLGPVAGPLGRAPAGGRNWEGFSSDPYLTGVMMSQTVQGIQNAGVIACSKHFIGNEQEHFRDSISSNIDDITLHELYLWPFADAVKAGTGSIMCSYNQINNSYACQNSYMLNYILKSELGFQGFVLSDWSAQHSGVGAALAGMDMTMPGDVGFDSANSYWGANLTISVLNGTVPQWRLDDMATRIVAAWYYVGRDGTQKPVNFDSWTLDTNGNEFFFAGAGFGVINQHVDVRANHGDLIRQIGAQSIVLLKNVNNTLPLTGKEKLTAVFGEDAGPNPLGPNGCGDRGCDMGTLAMGWGSGTANFPYLIDPLAALQDKLSKQALEFEINNGAIGAISALAARASAALVFVDADSGEGYINVGGNQGDRNNLTFWRNGDAVVNAASSNCRNTILVIHSTGPVLIDQYKNNPNITAILWAGLPGEQSGNSLVDVLYGSVNPSAKLPFTIGKTRQDYGVDLLYESNEQVGVPQQTFKEGVFIDYRSFDQHNITPSYEFGFGLSYTSYKYSNLQITPHTVRRYHAAGGLTPAAPATANATSNMTSSYLFPRGFNALKAFIYPFLTSTDLRTASGDPNYGAPGSVPAGATNSSAQPIVPAGGAPGGNPLLYDVVYTVTATITNTGSRVGNEVPQLYISLGGPFNPPRVLRGFDRIRIDPGQSATFRADITRRDISNWDPAAQNWAVNDYAKTVFVGASSRNLPLQAPLPAVAYSN